MENVVCLFLFFSVGGEVHSPFKRRFLRTKKRCAPSTVACAGPGIQFFGGNVFFFFFFLLNDGAVLWYSPGSPTMRKIWDTTGYKRVSHAFGGMRV